MKTIKNTSSYILDLPGSNTEQKIVYITYSKTDSLQISTYSK